jgi:Predicted Zn-dependent peptidases, insulinase-like
MLSKHPAYDCIEEHDLPEYRCKGILFRHKKTGCEVYRLVSQDSENVFAFAFRTKPSDGTGVAHIVEHSVLCGSERFPVKDSFLVMARRSLATFMNAFTYPDKTVYPAASAVEADYFNLMDVYGDAVFFPRLTEDTFLQEAHRFELDEKGGLDIKGVVYNEMRGDYSSSDSLATTACYTSLFSPGHPYSFDSGGDPEEIPKLSYESFKAFWASHYHPANCRVFLYGDIDTDKQLSFLDERFLSRFDRIEPDSEIPLQAPMGEAKRVEVPYPLASGSDSATSIIVNWLTVPVTDGVLALAMEVISELLVGHDGAPLALALRESGLGEDLSPQCGLDSGFRQIIFSAGLRGARRGDEGKVEALIADTIERVAAQGFSSDALDAALHGIAFSNREIRRGSGAYGLRLFNRAARGWLHGAGPEATLSFEKPLAELKARMAKEPRYLEELALDYIARSKHRSTVTVYPQAGLLESKRDERARSLAAAAARMSEGEKAALREKAAALEAAMERPDAPEEIAKLPKLRRRDLRREIEKIDHESATAAGSEVLVHPLFTNGIVYLDLAFPLEALSRAELVWLPLLSRFVIGAGLPGERYDSVSSRLARSAGAFSAMLESGTPVGVPGTPKGVHETAGVPGARRAASYAIFRLKALSGRFPDALDIVTRLLVEADYGDFKRLEDLCAELRNDVISALVPAGNAFAQTRAASGFGEASAIEDLWRGTSQVEFLLGLKDAKGEDLSAALSAIAAKIFGRAALRINVTAEKESLPAVLAALDSCLSRIPASPTSRPAIADASATDYAPAKGAESYTISSQVGFAAAACPSSRIGSPEFGYETVLAHLVSTGPLWEELRVKRGAYGASAWTDGLEGLACFSSYRDPRPVDSLSFFGEALAALGSRFAEGGEAAEAEIEEAAIGALGHEQKPLMPEERGFVDFRRHLYGIGDDARQAKRDAMLGASAKDLAAAAKRLAAAYEASAVPVLISRAEDAQYLLRGYPAARLRELAL